MKAEHVKQISEYFEYRKGMFMRNYEESKLLYPLVYEDAESNSTCETEFGKVSIKTYLKYDDVCLSINLILTNETPTTMGILSALEYYLAHKEEIPKVLAAGYKASSSKGLKPLLSTKHLIAALQRVLEGKSIFSATP